MYTVGGSSVGHLVCRFPFLVVPIALGLLFFSMPVDTAMVSFVFDSTDMNKAVEILDSHSYSGTILGKVDSIPEGWESREDYSFGEGSSIILVSDNLEEVKSLISNVESGEWLALYFEDLKHLDEIAKFAYDNEFASVRMPDTGEI